MAVKSRNLPSFGGKMPGPMAIRFSSCNNRILNLQMMCDDVVLISA